MSTRDVVSFAVGVVVISSFLGCGDKKNHSDEDAGDVDSSLDADIDTDTDGDTDADNDTDTDTDGDTETQGDSETGSDTDTDRENHTDIDTDTGTETGPEVEGDTDANGDSDTGEVGCNDGDERCLRDRIFRCTANDWAVVADCGSQGLICRVIDSEPQCGNGTGGDGGVDGDPDADTDADSDPDLTCPDLLTPTTCEEAHGSRYGCCAGDVVHYWLSSSVGSFDSGIRGQTCGWNGSYYDCVDAASADPTHPDGMCCGGTNPYGDCSNGTSYDLIVNTRFITMAPYGYAYVYVVDAVSGNTLTFSSAYLDGDGRYSFSFSQISDSSATDQQILIYLYDASWNYVAYYTQTLTGDLSGPIVYYVYDGGVFSVGEDTVYDLYVNTAFQTTAPNGYAYVYVVDVDTGATIVDNSAYLDSNGFYPFSFAEIVDSPVEDQEILLYLYGLPGII